MHPSRRSNGYWTDRGYLPHYVVPGERQFVTFSLADALPRRAAAAAAARDDDPDGRAAAIIALHRSLDEGLGSCALREPRLARLVEDALLFFDGDRYRIAAWVVMPSHVHAAMELAPRRSVTEVVASWKSFTARQANRALGRSGRFWGKDFFDVRIRDDDHMARVRGYIERNPVAAGLCRSPSEWPFSSAFRRRRRIEEG